MNKTILNAVLLALLFAVVMTTGCFDLGSVNCYVDTNGEFMCDADIGLGNGGGGGYGYDRDYMTIEWDSGYYDDPNINVTDLQVSCEFTAKDAQGNRYDFTVVGDTYIVDGYMAYIYFDGIDPLFDAECAGSVSYNYGPAISLFDDDSQADGSVTQVLWEMDVVAENDVYERNFELDIDRL